MLENFTFQNSFKEAVWRFPAALICFQMKQICFYFNGFTYEFFMMNFLNKIICFVTFI